MEKSSERTDELLSKFRIRLSLSPFTLDGLPPEEECGLTKDIWDSLTETEKTVICDKIRADFMGRYEIKRNLPDPTPYAMRLAHRYLDIVNREKFLPG